MTTHKVGDWWWEDDRTFCLTDKETGETFKLEGCYVKDVRFGELETDLTENVTMINNNKSYQ